MNPYNIVAEITVNDINKGGRNIIKNIHDEYRLLGFFNGEYYSVFMQFGDNKDFICNNTYKVKIAFVFNDLVNNQLFKGMNFELRDGILWDGKNHWASGTVLEIKEK